MENVIRTAYDLEVQTHLKYGLAYKPKVSSTLNEKLSINETLAASAEHGYKSGYIAVGNGGHTMVTGGAVIKPERVYHKATDAALYNQLPFIARKLAEDLTGSDLDKYAMRKVEQIAGIDYAFYYLVRLDNDTMVVDTQTSETVAGVRTYSVFTPTVDNLNPIAPTVATPGTHYVSDKQANVNTQLSFKMSANDVSEFINAVKLKYLDEGYAIISEIALCSGLEKDVSGTIAGGSTATFKEVIGVQVNAFINAFEPAMFKSAGIEIRMLGGVSEPLYETF